jgi:hypothetical protein
MEVIGLHHLQVCVVLFVEGKHPGPMILNDAVDAAILQRHRRELIRIEHNYLDIITLRRKPLFDPLEHRLHGGRTPEFQVFLLLCRRL